MRCARLADEAHAARREIGLGAERIEHLAVGAAVERVDGEVAPARVRRPVVGEGDGGVAAVRLHVLAQRRHLVGDVGRDHRDRAVRDAGRHRREARGSRRRHHLLGPRRRGDVDVDDRPAEQRVAHGAADGARREAAGGERSEHGLRLGPREPVGPGEARQLAGRRGRSAMSGVRYFSWPGSMRPSLPMCGGV